MAFDENSENYKKSLYGDFKYKEYNGKLVITTDYDFEACNKYPNYEKIQEQISNQPCNFLWESLDDRNNPKIRPSWIKGYRVLVKPCYDWRHDLSVEEYNYQFEMEVINRQL